jgi:hypothetical protein
MEKYEYKVFDLSPTWSLNGEKKMQELTQRLNELGEEGWILISGIEISKYATFIRKKTDNDKK